MKNSRLVKDFGVTALLATIVVLGTFIILIIGLLQAKFDMDKLLYILSGWVGAVLGGFFTLKGSKMATGNKVGGDDITQPPTGQDKPPTGK